MGGALSLSVRKTKEEGFVHWVVHTNSFFRLLKDPKFLDDPSGHFDTYIEAYFESDSPYGQKPNCRSSEYGHVYVDLVEKEIIEFNTFSTSASFNNLSVSRSWPIDTPESLTRKRYPMVNLSEAACKYQEKGAEALSEDEKNALVFLIQKSKDAHRHRLYQKDWVPEGDTEASFCYKHAEAGRLPFKSGQEMLDSVYNSIPSIHLYNIEQYLLDFRPFKHRTSRSRREHYDVLSGLGLGLDKKSWESDIDFEEDIE